MAAAIVDVLRSDALDGMAIAARAAVERHDWVTIGRTFAAQVMALVRGR